MAKGTSSAKGKVTAVTARKKPAPKKAPQKKGTNEEGVSKAGSNRGIF